MDGCSELRLGQQPCSERRGTPLRQSGHWRLLHGGRECALSARPASDLRMRAKIVRHQDDVENASHSTELTRTVRLSHNTWKRDELTAAILGEDLAQIEHLVRQGASFKLDYHYRPEKLLVNPVDWAALQSCFRASTRLAECGQAHGLDLSKTTRYAVWVAAANGQLELLRTLLKASVPVHNRHLQESALHVAVRQASASRIKNPRLDDPSNVASQEVITLLLRYGAWAVEPQRDIIKEFAKPCLRHAELAKLTGLHAVLEAAGIADIPDVVFTSQGRDDSKQDELPDKLAIEAFAHSAIGAGS